MTLRQSFLKAFYPILIWVNKLTGKKRKTMQNINPTIVPNKSIYDLSVTLNSHKELPLEHFRGKKLLIVNTASNCGYTNQYDDLQKLSEVYHDKIAVIGFPANDFKEQEKGSDEEIAEFCRVNYGVTFPLATKSTVIKTADQNPIFRWLSDSNENGWNNQQPTWNFSKYLIDENGHLMRYFDPGVSPMDEEVLKAIQQ